MLKMACAIFVLMSFVGGVFAMLAFSFQKVDLIRKGRPKFIQRPSFRLLIVWMIFFGIFGAYYFSESRFTGQEHLIWYFSALFLMPICALLGTGLIRIAMADKIKKIITVFREVEAKEEARGGGKKANKKGKGKDGEDEVFQDYDTVKDETKKYEDDENLYRLGKDKDKEIYFKDYM